ncbi:MAG: hypothetical protein ABIJ45_05025 [Candidatus Zixiibacteriota bacterium]
MVEKKDSGANKKFDPDDRFKYVGFDVHQGKIGDLFKSDKDKDGWVKRVLDKRAKFGARLREKTTLDEPRVVTYEKIVMTVTSLLLIASLFMPWFSGYTEHEVEVAPAVVEETAMVDSTMTDSLIDSLAAAPAGAVTQPMEEMAGTQEPGGHDIAAMEKDDAGFASITGHQKRKEIRREYQSFSAIGALTQLGTIGGGIFSSGFVLIITGILIMVYILICIGSAGYTIYSLFGLKGTEDEKALVIKKALRINWIPVGIWFFCMVLSIVGAGYSFDSTGLMKQLGTSYGIETYLGLLSYGFYISLGCFVMNAVKAVEI